MGEDHVTLRDIYDSINLLRSEMGERIEKIETRVGVIEAFQNKALGMIALFTFAATYVWNEIIRK